MFSIDEIERLRNSCRLCLANDEQDVSLFSKFDNCGVEYCKIASTLVDIKIQQNDNLPDKICHECASKLFLFYKFKQKCQTSSDKLQSLIPLIIPPSSKSIEIIEILEVPKDEPPSLIYFQSKIEEQPPLDIVFDESSNTIQKIEVLDDCGNKQDVEIIEVIDTKTNNIPVLTKLIVEQININDVMKKPKKKVTLQCELCGQTFGQISSLNQHYNTHTGIKKFSCTLCPKKFTRKSHLTIHMRLHYNIKPYICEICSRRFTKSGDLHRHLLVHTDIKNYECQVCKKRFKRSTDVRSHMNSHSGNKPYQCKNCDKAYTSHSSLKKHTMKFHI